MPVLIKHDEEYYRQRKPQPDLGAIKNFKRFLWDAERRAFLDRTAQEWVNVGIFYLCFYIVLFSFTALQFWIMYKSVACSEKPYFQYDQSVLGRAWLEPSRRNMPTLMNLHGPGIVFKPNVLRNGHTPRILIDESNDNGQPQKYIEAIDKILAEYNVDKSKFEADCNDKPSQDDEKKPCFFDVTTLAECSRSPYGYTGDSPKPCVYIKINKRYGWWPIYYSKSSILPEDMPRWLQKIIHETDQYHVWLSCEGTSEDNQAKLGEIEYLPRPGFPVQFFPFDGRKNYLSPMVALRFKNLPVDQQVTVECKTWARNIDNENRYNLKFKVMYNKQS